MNKSSICLTKFIIVICCIVVSAQSEITSERIGENVLVLKGGGGNITAISTEDGLVVIDTFMTPASAREARKLIEEFSNKPICYVINTHYHSDHTFGNQVFDEALIIGHYKCVERILARYGDVRKGPVFWENRVKDLERQLNSAGPDSEAAAQLEVQLQSSRQLLEESRDFVFTPPELAIHGGATLMLGGKTFKILNMGPGHSDTDLIIHVPEERLLVMGDLFLPKRIPYVDFEGGADPQNWILIFDELIQMSSEYDHVVSGHGDIHSIEELKEQRECMTALWDAVCDAWNRGLSLEQAQKEIKLEKHRDYISFERGKSLNIENCWRILESRTRQ